MAVQPLESFPPEDRVHVERLRGCLGEISMSASRFGSAVDLFEFVETSFQEAIKERGVGARTTLGNFQEIAAREAVMQVHHFRQAVNGAQTNLALVPSLKDVIDTKRWRQARRDFDAEFPGWEAMRNAVGHFAEIAATEKTYQANAVTFPPRAPLGQQDTLRIVFSSLAGDIFKITKGGDIYSLSVSRKTYSRLCAIKTELIGSYANA